MEELVLTLTQKILNLHGWEFVVVFCVIVFVLKKQLRQVGDVVVRTLVNRLGTNITNDHTEKINTIEKITTTSALLNGKGERMAEKINVLEADVRELKKETAKNTGKLEQILELIKNKVY